MDRAELAAFIAMNLDISLAEAGIKTTDTLDGLAPILDRVEMLAPIELDAEGLRKLARYCALDRIADRLMMNMRVSVRGNNYSAKDQYDNVLVRLKEAKAAVAWIVEPTALDPTAVPSAIPYAVIVPGPEW